MVIILSGFQTLHQTRGDSVVLTPAEAADHLGLSTAELTRLRAAGTGPDWGLIGRTVRYTRTDLNNWTTNRRRNAG